MLLATSGAMRIGECAFGAEKAGDAESMRFVLDVLREDVQHDFRSLSLVVGTALGDGDVHFARKVVAAEMPSC